MEGEQTGGTTRADKLENLKGISLNLQGEADLSSGGHALWRGPKGFTSAGGGVLFSPSRLKTGDFKQEGWNQKK